MGAFAPWQWFLLGVVVALLGLAVLWFLGRRFVAEWRKRNPILLPILEQEEAQPREQTAFGRFLAAVLRPLEWLLGTRGQAIYRATYHTRSWSDLCSRIEGAARASCPSESGVEIQVIEQPTWVLRAYRGMTSGFLIQLIPHRAQPGEACGLLLVSRWSRWHTWSVHAATGCFFLALFGCIAMFAVAGWQPPGVGYLILGISFGVAVVAIRLMRPVLAAVEYSGRNGLAEDETAVVVERVRAAVEKSPEATVALPPDAAIDRGPVPASRGV